MGAPKRRCAWSRAGNTGARKAEKVLLTRARAQQTGEQLENPSLRSFCRDLVAVKHTCTAHENATSQSAPCLARPARGPGFSSPKEHTRPETGSTVHLLDPASVFSLLDPASPRAWIFVPERAPPPSAVHSRGKASATRVCTSTGPAASPHRPGGGAGGGVRWVCVCT